MFRFLMILFFILLMVPSVSSGQSFRDHDEAVNKLMNKHIDAGKLKNSMPGFRVQIFFGSDRNEANRMKSEFLKLYPETGAYVVYHQPNFKLRVGDFKTRLQASEFLNEIQPAFPMGFLVKDDVRLPR